MTIEQPLLQLMNATSINSMTTLQTLWNGYGSINHYSLSLASGAISSVVVKLIQSSSQSHHPRGWNTNRSHERKLRSYQVEQHWYEHWAKLCDTDCKIAQHWGSFELPAVDENSPATTAIVLSDLDALGFSRREQTLSLDASKPCLSWLANFHAQFMIDSTTNTPEHKLWPEGLWPTGSYWHLATRPDEFKAMADCDLKTHAHAIDRSLNNCQFKTLVHGDAKVANFCFKESGNDVAVVDFQYVGGGCGMKDVAYFLGSCLSEADCAEHYPELLNHYFKALTTALNKKHPALNAAAIETEWRALFSLAWADFHRFILGWSPQHFKNNGFSDFMSRKAIATLSP